MGVLYSFIFLFAVIPLIRQKKALSPFLNKSVRILFFNSEKRYIFANLIKIMVLCLTLTPLTNSWSIEETNYKEVFDQKVLPWVRGFKVKTFQGLKDKKLAYLCFPKKCASQAIVISSGRTEYIPKYFELAYDIFHSDLLASVCLYDHRGQGLSDRVIKDPRKGHVEDFEYYVTDFAKMIELVKSMGHKEVYVWGQSMGGAIAIRTAQRYPKLMSGMAFFLPF